MKKNTILMTFVLVLLVLNSLIIAQGRPYVGPDDPAADIAAERTGFMTGNRVLLFYRNTTELGNCCDLGYFPSKWPNDHTGTLSHDGFSLMIGAHVYLENDTIPVTDVTEIESRTDLDELYYIQASYRHGLIERDPTGTIEWGLYPVFGYFNETSETPAMSNLPESWPLLGWPSQGNDLKWPGEWNGRFGRGVMKADQECYFVANDAQDLEYLGPEDTVKYYPRRIYGSNGEIISDLRIGDKKPDVTIQNGEPWGGIGIRVEVRGFQWSNPSAQDAIFWEYTMANTSEYDLPEMLFGLLLDNAVGGESYSGKGADDNSYFDKSLNLCYTWDTDGIPIGGGKEPGVLGVAYLESPGLPYDGIDNDNDGLLDEKRDNEATQIIGPYDGIHDLDAFKAFYGLKESELKEHWDADEDQDWLDGDDVNNNGRYDFGEDAGDDLGLDGVGPFDLNYKGPDADGTECNHKPDLAEGIGAEPNFGLTDVNESDMLGLTTFRFCLDWGVGKPGRPSADELTYKYLSENIFEDYQSAPSNYLEEFASGIFPLNKGLTERISMSELHAYDPLAGLNSEEHHSPALFSTKVVVQAIYEADYRFAQPPLMPTLSATPSDGRVFLNWDDRSDKLTRDGFVGNQNDFEGYKLYRSTDAYLQDPQIITDGYGSPMLRAPIFQCDLVDTIKGFADFTHINGVLVYLGEDSGLSHSFIDETVHNGRTYYYVLTAYDYGVKDVGDGIPPSENSFVLELDENENIRRISQNVAIVKPFQKSAGYQSASVTIENPEDLTFGEITPEIYEREAVKGDHKYQINFEVTEVDYLKGERYHNITDALYYTSGIKIYDITTGRELVYSETPEYFRLDNLILYDYDKPSGLEHKWGFQVDKTLYTDVFDGFRLKINFPRLDAEFDVENTGWRVGSSPMNVNIGYYAEKFLPWNYEIIFTDPSELYKSKLTNTTKVDSAVSQNGGSIDRSKVLTGESFPFYVVNKDFADTNGNPIVLDIVVHDRNENGVFDILEDELIVGPLIELGSSKLWGGTPFGFDFTNLSSESELPKPNDVYEINFKRPYHYVDSIQFVVHPAEVPTEDEEINMDNIRVVPNPYVVTNSMETAVANWQRNQRRQIMFTNIPSDCQIQIFTVSGVLIDEINVDNSTSSSNDSWDLNSSANGTVHWDLRTNEGLEIAAGYYLYHVKSNVTGDVKVGKFAVIK